MLVLISPFSFLFQRVCTERTLLSLFDSQLVEVTIKTAFYRVKWKTLCQTVLMSYCIKKVVGKRALFVITNIIWLHQNPITAAIHHEFFRQFHCSRHKCCHNQIESIYKSNLFTMNRFYSVFHNVLLCVFLLSHSSKMIDGPIKLSNLVLPMLYIASRF